MKRILFVCVKNSSRSQIAEALVKMDWPQVEAYSAGIHPGEKVNPTAVEAMRELGYDLSGHRARHVSAFSHLTFDAVYKMDAPDLSDYVKAKWMENWDVPDPAQGTLEHFRAVRDMIRQRIARLRGSLEGEGEKPWLENRSRTSASTGR
jgi:arsenate reductase (thioredoxin)